MLFIFAQFYNAKPKYNTLSQYLDTFTEVANEMLLQHERFNIFIGKYIHTVQLIVESEWE